MTVYHRAFVVMLASYVLGSIPFGLMIAFAWCGVDIRKVGSGNIGATNVQRVCGRAAGAVCFVLDVGKGLAPPLMAEGAHLGSAWQIGAAACAILGHVFSVFLKFKGGKGIATGLGALLGIAPMAGIVGFALFGLGLVATRYVSVGSLLGATSLPVSMLIFYRGDWTRFVFACLCVVLAWVRHRANIVRLARGEESRISLRRRAAAGDPPTDGGD